MPDAATDSARTSERIKDIPLYLIPKTIADQIRKKREAVAYIEVRPEKGHFFTITIKTSERRVFRRTGAAETGGETGE